MCACAWNPISESLRVSSFVLFPPRMYIYVPFLSVRSHLTFGRIILHSLTYPAHRVFPEQGGVLVGVFEYIYIYSDVCGRIREKRFYVFFMSDYSSVVSLLPASTMTFLASSFLKQLVLFRERKSCPYIYTFTYIMCADFSCASALFLYTTFLNRKNDLF